MYIHTLMITQSSPPDHTHKCSCSCILGVYDVNVDNAKIINTVMLLVKMYIINFCKYDRSVLFRVAFVQIFIYKVMLLGRLYDNDVFVQLTQMFADT